ncbi:MAG: DUF3524 domain-containing protein [Acidobacteriota bacterium]
MSESLRILALEPYYGGSHRAFLDSWVERSAHRFTVLTLPPHHWKWRMRHSAASFAAEVREILGASASVSTSTSATTAGRPGDQRWDGLLVTSMVNLAELYGLLPAGLRGLPAVVYFHENQLTYPSQSKEDPRDAHFGLIHWTTMLAASEVWFNSEFHRRELSGALDELLAAMPDSARSRPLRRQARQRLRQARVQAPGIDAAPQRESLPGDPPGELPEEALSILWAARWEHDKDPETFFAALQLLVEAGVDFRVDVLGESFRRVPEVFQRARESLGDRVRRWGYLPRREDYRQALAGADVFVSTARHEFFGLSAVEAMASGAWPLLPRRLSYPELLSPLQRPERFLWEGGAENLAARLRELAGQRRDAEAWRRSLAPCIAAARRFAWCQRAPELDRALVEAVRGSRS